MAYQDAGRLPEACHQRGIQDTKFRIEVVKKWGDRHQHRHLSVRVNIPEANRRVIVSKGQGIPIRTEVQRSFGFSVPRPPALTSSAGKYL